MHVCDALDLLCDWGHQLAKVFSFL